MKKKRRIVLSLVLALVLCGAGMVQASDYYVAPPDAGGNDANPGTLAQPWASPSRGAGMRVSGAHSAGATVINVRDSAGYLPSGNLNIAGLGTVAYTSKTDLTFTLASPLSAAVGDGTYVHDADILGGDGFDPGDNIILRGGMYCNYGPPFVTTAVNPRIRLRDSGTAGNPITYKAYPGETPELYMANLYLDGTSVVSGVVWSDGQEQAQKTEFVNFEGLTIRADQNAGVSTTSSAVNLNSLNSSVFNNCDLIATGGPSDDGSAILAYKCQSLSVTNSLLYSRYERAIGQSGDSSMSVSYSVIGGELYGAINTGGTFTGDHLTIVGLSTYGAHLESGGTITNSILIDIPGTAGSRSSAGSDYNYFYNNGTHIDAGNWNAGAGLGANEVIGDPGFIIGGYTAYNDANKSDPDWLRYNWSSAAATAGVGGTWIGAFEPVPEPATLMVLAVSGISALLLRRRR